MAVEAAEVIQAPPSASRRHDLDALRASAMLLGIGLHAAMSFVPGAWLVTDSAAHPGFGLLLAMIHGFRMPLFFLLSGFFTAMMLRRRGFRDLLKNRAVRIFVPCLLGLLTIVPLTMVASIYAIYSGGYGGAPKDDGTVIAAVRLGDHEALLERLEAGGDAKAVDVSYGVSSLSWACLSGDEEAVKILLDAGVDPNIENRDGNRPLHAAAFTGRDGVAALLLDRGADPNARAGDGNSAIDSTKADANTTKFLAGMLNVKVPEGKELDEGRAKIRERLEPLMGAASPVAEAPKDLVTAYRDFIYSDRMSVGLGPFRFHFVSTSLFSHLWFLWFLCWLIPAFLAGAWVIGRWEGLKMPRWLVVSPASFLWLIPLTALPQSLMASGVGAFGADTADGLIPPPHLLLYYGVFFLYGALYYASDDHEGRLGRGWWWMLLVALCVAFPLGMASASVGRPLSVLGQVAYAWAMSFALMGLVRAFLTKESRAIRYVSDSSYWLYLVHLPLVIAAQVVVRDWPIPGPIKLVLIAGVITAFLLVTYQLIVRYTWIGRLLNGPRKREGVGTAALE